LTEEVAVHSVVWIWGGTTGFVSIDPLDAVDVHVWASLM